MKRYGKQQQQTVQTTLHLPVRTRLSLETDSEFDKRSMNKTGEFILEQVFAAMEAAGCRSLANLNFPNIVATASATR